MQVAFCAEADAAGFGNRRRWPPAGFCKSGNPRTALAAWTRIRVCPASALRRGFVYSGNWRVSDPAKFTAHPGRYMNACLRCRMSLYRIRRRRYIRTLAGRQTKVRSASQPECQLAGKPAAGGSLGFAAACAAPGSAPGAAVTGGASSAGVGRGIILVDLIDEDPQYRSALLACKAWRCVDHPQGAVAFGGVLYISDVYRLESRPVDA